MIGRRVPLFLSTAVNAAENIWISAVLRFKVQRFRVFFPSEDNFNKHTLLHYQTREKFGGIHYDMAIFSGEPISFERNQSHLTLNDEP